MDDEVPDDEDNVALESMGALYHIQRHCKYDPNSKRKDGLGPPIDAFRKKIPFDVFLFSPIHPFFEYFSPHFINHMTPGGRQKYFVSCSRAFPVGPEQGGTALLRYSHSTGWTAVWDHLFERNVPTPTALADYAKLGLSPALSTPAAIDTTEDEEYGEDDPEPKIGSSPPIYDTSDDDERKKPASVADTAEANIPAKKVKANSAKADSERFASAAPVAAAGFASKIGLDYDSDEDEDIKSTATKNSLQDASVAAAGFASKSNFNVNSPEAVLDDGNGNFGNGNRKGSGVKRTNPTVAQSGSLHVKKTKKQNPNMATLSEAETKEAFKDCRFKKQVLSKFSSEQVKKIEKHPPPGTTTATVNEFISHLVSVMGWRLCKNGTFRQVQKANHFSGFVFGTKKK